MNYQAIIGLALVVTALVLGSIVLSSNSDRDNSASRFLSLPKRPAEWLRLLLISLVAYIVCIEIFSRFGYTFPALRAFHAEGLTRYALVLLGVASLVALFVEGRLGIVFTIISVLLVPLIVLGAGVGAIPAL